MSIKSSLSKTNLSFLPYNPTILIKDISQKLSLVEFMHQLIFQLRHAIDSFYLHQWHQFDAQVGETLCQIRAYKIYTLSVTKNKGSDNIFNLINNTLDVILPRLESQINFIKQQISVAKQDRPIFLSAALTLEQFFSEIDCIFEVNEDILFLYLSYFLCKYNVLDDLKIPVTIDFERIGNDLSLSRSYAKKIGHFYQKQLSELSCDFVFQLMDDMDEYKDLKQLLTKLQMKSDEGREVLPCYCVTEIILSHMIQHEAKMILLIDFIENSSTERISYILQGSTLHNQFVMFPNDLLDNSGTITKEAYMLFYGRSQTKPKVFNEQIFLSSGLSQVKELILRNNAEHPQYSGNTLSKYRNNPYHVLINNFKLKPSELKLADTRAKVIDRLKSEAQLFGCGYVNPKTFLLQHIFCDRADPYYILSSNKELA